MKRNQQGFSLLEIIISLSVGLVLFAGIMSVFVGMRTTTQETNSLGALQENGRFALSMITEDLMRQSFWGDLVAPLSSSNVSSNDLPSFPATGDCTGQGLNNSSFPQATGHFRTLWGMTASTSSPINCIDDASIGSDVLQLKRVLANPFAVGTVGNDADSNQFFLNTNSSNGTIFPGKSNLPVINNAQVWQYLHHVYYVKDESQGDISVPVLMRGALSNAGGDLMLFQPMIDGIEIIHLMYGVDTDGDGSVNAYISPNVMTTNYWDNANAKILAVKVYILARDILPDADYVNETTYLLGDLSFTPDTTNNHYRRLLLNSTVTLYNAGVDAWNSN